jgi:hypothetical protein
LLTVKYPTVTNALSEARTAIPRFMFVLGALTSSGAECQDVCDMSGAGTWESDGIWHIKGEYVQLFQQRFALHHAMSVPGTERTSSDVSSMVAIGGKADVAQIAQFGRE